MNHSDTTQINLRRSGKFKTIQDQSTSGDTSSLTFNVDLKLAIDNDNSINRSKSYTYILIRQSVTDVDAGTGNTNRNLRPRHHMDKF